MHRWYRAEHYAERIQLIRSTLPDAAIGADVIAGFPGETDEDFRATFEFIERLPFTYLHVFSFLRSSRHEGRRSRCARVALRSRATARERLRTLGQQKAAAFRELQAGTNGARAHAGARRRHLDRSADRKLLEGACRRPPSRESLVRSAHQLRAGNRGSDAEAELSSRR